MQAKYNFAAVSVAFAELLVTQLDRHEEGCEMLQEAIRLYHEMGVPEEAEARELAEGLGC